MEIRGAGCWFAILAMVLCAPGCQALSGAHRGVQPGNLSRFGDIEEDLEPIVATNAHRDRRLPARRPERPEEVADAWEQSPSSARGSVPPQSSWFRTLGAVRWFANSGDADQPIALTAASDAEYGDASTDPGGELLAPQEPGLAPACEISWRNDCDDLFPMLKADIASLFTWENAIVLGAGVGVALGLRENADGEVRAYTAEFPLRWGEGSEVLRQFGEFQWQVPVLAGLYGVSLWTEDENLHNFSKAVISAYAITSVTTVTIKGLTDTNRPTNQFQGGRFGFPSFHTASTFSMAAVIDEYCGWQCGLPAYALAGLVGWSRIDQREHDLSDVVFGSILGYVIGKSVARAHLDREGAFQIVPYYEPESGTAGAVFETSF